MYCFHKVIIHCNLLYCYLQCFACGVESGTHKKDHDYTVMVGDKFDKDFKVYYVILVILFS